MGLMLRERICESLEDTERLGRSMAEHLEPGDAIGLVGDLGAGKTHFVQAVAAGLNVPRSVRVTSPTFALINEYRGGRLDMVHADLYRIEEARELRELGIEELIDGPVVSFIEWSDRFGVLPADHLLVRIEVLGESRRRLVAEAFGDRAQALLAAWLDSLP